MDVDFVLQTNEITLNGKGEFRFTSRLSILIHSTQFPFPCLSPFMTAPNQSPDNRPAPRARKKRGMMDVITGQKLLIYGMIGYLCATPILAGANAFLGGTTEEPIVTSTFVVVLMLGVLAFFAAATVGAMGILRMGAVLFPESRYVYAIGAVLPIIGLIVMFISNAKATKYLKERGVTVGFLGAKR